MAWRREDWGGGPEASHRPGGFLGERDNLRDKVRPKGRGYRESLVHCKEGLALCRAAGPTCQERAVLGEGWSAEMGRPSNRQEAS